MSEGDDRDRGPGMPARPRLPEDGGDGVSHRRSHAVQHRCFPPQPDRCLICGKEGVALDTEPCILGEFTSAPSSRPGSDPVAVAGTSHSATKDRER